MKILRIISRLNIGGPAIHVTNLNSRIGNSVLVYGDLADGEGSMEYLLDEKCLDNICLHSLGREISLFKDIATIFSLIKIIWQEKPDVVHTHTAKAGFVGRIAARLCGVKKVYHTFHGNIFQGYFSKSKTKLFILIERFLAKISTKIIAISPEQKKDLLKYGICPEDKIEVIPLGFDLQKFRSLNSPKNAKNIGIVGRLVPIKNHRFFLEIAQNFPEFNFHIFGDGELRSQLQAVAPQNVIFHGFSNNMPQVYRQLDLLLLTSLNEGTPVAVIEAIASGVPVLSTDVGGVRDVIDNIASCKVLPAQLEEFVKYLPIFLQVTVTETERDITCKRYSVDRLVEDIKNLYNS